MIIVKVYRVFPSNLKKTVSSQLIQIHYINIGDSGEVVTPFIHVGTYPTRYFTTLGPLRLQPPFIGTYIICKYKLISFYNIGQVSNPILLFPNLQSLKFLLNSRHSLFCYAFKQALLLQKLRSQFAEFLQYYYYNTLTYSVNLSVANFNTVH